MHTKSYLLYFDKFSEIELVNISIRSFTGSAVFVGSKSKLNIISSDFEGNT